MVLTALRRVGVCVWVACQQVASGMALSKVHSPAANPCVVQGAESEREQKYRVDRLYLIFNTARRWDVNKIFLNLDWA